MEQTVFEFLESIQTNCGSPESIRFVDQNLGQPAVKQVFLAVLLYYKRSFAGNNRLQRH